jgi:hypothetical protein
MSELIDLACFIHQRNQLDGEITRLLGRPANAGHIGEYVASIIFSIKLEKSASNKGFDGFFTEMPFKDRSVNIKWFANNDGLLDINADALPDYYLVLTGPKSHAISSRGQIHPWVINFVYLFDSHQVIFDLKNRNSKIGNATSIQKHLWDNAEIFPAHNRLFELSQEQREALQLFS